MTLVTIGQHVIPNQGTGLRLVAGPGYKPEGSSPRTSVHIKRGSGGRVTEREWWEGDREGVVGG